MSSNSHKNTALDCLMLQIHSMRQSICFNICRVMPRSHQQRYCDLVHQQYVHFQQNAVFALQHCFAEAVAVRFLWCICGIYEIVCLDSLTELEAEGECLTFVAHICDRGVNVCSQSVMFSRQLATTQSLLPTPQGTRVAVMNMVRTQK